MFLIYTILSSMSHSQCQGDFAKLDSISDEKSYFVILKHLMLIECRTLE